ncbi:hypothetical protein AMTR_s00186p00047300 [Amborella trichopoda]|uniref:Uncharacterized protein n=1 Tax=Amborella trichopoda TaxID=13333 RepID=W1PAX6_AMBTC|nr:hypothetical protein AMTR_s00186p00047300 [Amborella trichopoda]
MGWFCVVLEPNVPHLKSPSEEERSQFDLLEDPAIIGALDEETEFNALVEEEAALLESLLTER